jgi:hypothetical protein
LPYLDIWREKNNRMCNGVVYYLAKMLISMGIVCVSIGYGNVPIPSFVDFVDYLYFIL